MRILVKCSGDYSFDKQHFQFEYDSDVVPRKGEFVEYKPFPGPASDERLFRVRDVFHDVEGGSKRFREPPGGDLKRVVIRVEETS
jgi:hypothetical protein